MDVILKTDFPKLRLFSSGKVRDNYELNDNLLMVTTDRISAFDSILASGIPYKGKVLNLISVFWFNFTKDILPNHLITANVDDYPENLKEYSDALKDRSMLVHRTIPFPVECVVRGYLAGSGWKEYKKEGTICGIELPEGLKEADKLPEPVFTPATKAESGHDENITFNRMCEIIGDDAGLSLREKALQVYKKAAKYAESKGIIIADTKFEFGRLGDEIIVIDEMLTPDSSRFWPKNKYEPGKLQPSFDKQFVRDYLETSGWDKEPPGPELPQHIIDETTNKYLEAYSLLTGKKLR